MRLIDIAQFADKAGVSRTTLYERAKAETDFPRVVPDGRRRLYVESEVDGYLAARVARLRGEVQA